MKMGCLHYRGEIHALRGGWWLLARFFECGRAICHTKGRRLYRRFDNGSEAVTCNWCRQKLGLMTYRKGTPPPGEPVAVVKFDHPVGLDPEITPANLPSILFAEPAVIDVEAEEAGP